MAFDLPTDLIQRVQITLRTNAGIPSYDPGDPTLPSLLSVDATIAGLDTSAPYLRCKHCKGKLLRGLQSVICVYCGKRHKKDVKPDPIAFNSTLAYRWLLESLHFDGSEVVGPSSEGSEFNRSQNTPKEKISLSELLDLQITWPDEPEEPETIVTNISVAEQSKSTLNFSEVEYDDFFPGSERNTAVNASEEQPAISNQIAISGSNTFADPKNLSLFQDVPNSESDILSSIDVSADSFTGWEADFQSADARSQHEDSKPVEPIVDSAVDLSVHMDSIFGHTDRSNNGKLDSDLAPPPSVSDRIGDSQVNHVNSSGLQQAPQFDSVVEVTNALSSDNLGNKSSEIVGDDWFQDTKWQNSTVTSETINKDDDLFGEIVNTSAASPPPLANDWIQDDLLINIKSSLSEEEDQFKFSVKTDDVAPDFQNNQSLDSVDWFQDTKWVQNSADSMVNDDDDDIFGVRPKSKAAPSPFFNDWIQHDLLNNISSSETQQAEQFDLAIETKGGILADNANKPSSDNVDWFQDNLWQGNSDNAKDSTFKEEDDSFDEWNDFASSALNQDSSKNSWNQSGNEITASSQTKPEMDVLMSTDNFQEVDFSGFYQSDLFSGSSSNAIGIREVNYIQPEVSSSNRTTDCKVSKNSEQDVSIEAQSKDDVEMVMSQMHNLSFMLESSLSLPSKRDGFLQD